jgi:hypothetical protein
VEIRHSVQITIEFQGHEKLNMESSIILSSVNSMDCLELLDYNPDIVPALDYEKVVGNQEWVPAYAPAAAF